jgi:cell division GTPase FtsZ
MGVGSYAGLALTRPALSGLSCPGPLNVSIVGVGGTGGRLVSYLAKNCPDRLLDSTLTVEHFAVDTDHSALDSVASNVRKIWLPEPYMSCIFPAYGRQVAWRHRERLSPLWAAPGPKLVMAVAGMGRGTGSGVTQTIAWLGRQANSITVAYGVVPFSWEINPVRLGPEWRRLERAAHVVTWVALDESNQEATLAEIFAECDESVARHVHGMLYRTITSLRLA